MSRLLLLVCATLAVALLPTGTWPALAVAPAGQRAKAAEARIERALKKTVECEFVETPLDEVVHYFEDLCGVPILFDDSGLQDAMIDEGSTLVTFSIRGVTFESAMNLMLRHCGLIWTIADEAILITTPAKEEHMLVTRVYALGDLVFPTVDREVELDELIEGSFGYTNLHTLTGPPGFVHPVTVAGKPMVVVAQSPRRHREVVALLRALRDATGEAASADKRQAAEARIERALARKTECEFPGIPLTEALRFLAECHRIPILLDHKALEDAAVDPQRELVVLAIRGVALESVLNAMLRQVKLTWTITDEALLVTTPERQDYMLVTRVYPVDDLVGPGAGSEKQIDALMRAIRSPTETHTWTDSGKPGSVSAVTVRGKPVLVVSQPQRIHREIAALLQSLREAIRENGPASDP